MSVARQTPFPGELKKCGKVRNSRTKNKPEVSPDRIRVSYEAREAVEWQSEDGGRYTIEFREGSPYTDSVFVVPSGGSVTSGPLLDSVKVEQVYKYWVTDRQGDTTDPDIKIDP